jgi:hypothetical protein
MLSDVCVAGRVRTTCFGRPGGPWMSLDAGGAMFRKISTVEAGMVGSRYLPLWGERGLSVEARMVGSGYLPLWGERGLSVEARMVGSGCLTL